MDWQTLGKYFTCCPHALRLLALDPVELAPHTVETNDASSKNLCELEKLLVDSLVS